MTDEIKAVVCKFCKQAPEVGGWELSYRKPYYNAECPNCDILFRAATREEAVKLWNEYHMKENI